MENDAVKRFNSASQCTGQRVRRALLSLPDEVKQSAQEIRLRCGRPIVVCGLCGDVYLYDGGRMSYVRTEGIMRAAISDIEECFHIICGYSVHTHQHSICSGYVTVRGGHRAGIVGTAVCENNTVNAVRDISSINIRISRQYKGIADGLFTQIKSAGLCSTIVAGTPSSGKTTVLRDLARLLGNESGIKTVIVDEREELAACADGVPQNDIGVNTDVLSGYPKKDAIMIVLRSMAPDYIIMDEIGSVEEAQAIEAGLNSGVGFFLSVHASNRQELLRRPQVARLLASGAFGGVAMLRGRNEPSVINEYISAGEIIGEIGGCAAACRSSGNGGAIRGQTG